MFWNFTFMLSIAFWQKSVAWDAVRGMTRSTTWTTRYGFQFLLHDQSNSLDPSWRIYEQRFARAGYLVAQRYFAKNTIFTNIIDFFQRSWWSSRIRFQTIFNRIFINILWLLEIVNLFSIVVTKSRKNVVISWREQDRDSNDTDTQRTYQHLSVSWYTYFVSINSTASLESIILNTHVWSGWRSEIYLANHSISIFVVTWVFDRIFEYTKCPIFRCEMKDKSTNKKKNWFQSI